MQLLYTVLLYLLQPLVWLRLLWRSRKAPDYRRRWAERYGFCRGKVEPHGILVHAVSVGETVAAQPLIEQLRRCYPTYPITITTMTPTGSAQVKKHFANSVSHVYLPYDLPDALARFLNRLQPRLVIIMETELWPNLITQLYQRNIPLIIANARLSARSAKRYQKLGSSMATLLGKIPLIAAQSEHDGQRFVKLGLPVDHLSITGSIKFDIQLTALQHTQIEQLKQQWQQTRPIWIAASTHSGEDELILAAFKQLQNSYPDLLLILVPRHPERFQSVTKLVESQGLTYQLRSQKRPPEVTTQVIIGDTMGELVQLYSIADIAFVGGSLIEHGGHNPLEPALHKLAIIMGPSTFNFQAICRNLIEAEGMVTVQAQERDLVDKLTRLLASPTYRHQLGENAYRVLKANQGALNKLLRLIKQFLPDDDSVNC